MALAVPLVRAVTFVDDDTGELLTVHGIDITHDADVRLYHRANDAKATIPDALQFLNNPDSVVLTHEFADRRGLKRGDGIDLVTPAGVKHFVVRGLLNPEGLARTLRGRFVVMDLYAAERAFTEDGRITQIDVLVDTEASVETTKAAIAAALPAGFTVAEPAVRKDVIRRTIGGFQQMLTAFGLLAVAAGFVVCYSRLGAIATARMWEAGLMRAVGLRRSAVFGELLKESVLVGLAGTFIGIPIGFAIARWAVPLLAAATAMNFRLPATTVTPTIHWSVVSTGAAVGVSAALLATIAPAFRLARTPLATALTLRGRDLPLRTQPHVRVGIRAALLAAIVALVAIQRSLGLAAIGIVVTVLIGVLAASLVTPIARLGAAGFQTLAARAASPIGRLAISHVRAQPTRSALAVATLGFGLGTVFLFGMLAWSFERTLVARLMESERSDMVISSAFVTGGYRAAPLAETLLSELRTIPGVAVVAGQQAIDVQYAGGTIVLASCDATCFTDRRIYEWPLDGDALSDALARVARGDAALVTTSFVREYGLRPGETVQLPAPTGAVSLPIAAVTSGAPENAVWISRERYLRSWNDTTIWTANVALDHAADYAAVERTISARLGRRYRLLMRSSDELIEYFAGEVRQAFSLQYLLEGITLFLVVVAIGDTLASAVLSRTREIGMMRAIGMRRAPIFHMIVLEGATVGMLGLVLAMITGLALGTFWVTMQFPAVVGWDLDVHVPYRFAAGTIALTLLLCVAAAVLPAVRAARLPAAEALRRE